MAVTAPYGTWSSPITPQALVGGAIDISNVIPDQGSVYWSESRPDEGGRTAIMRYRDGQSSEITPAGANVRTTVHEYGGGSWTVAAGVVYFVDYADQRLRSISESGELTILTPAGGDEAALRFADFTISADRQWIIAVCERHSAEHSEAVNTLVAIANDGSGQITTLASGADFYAAPCLSADNSRLAWIEWQHPNMPWDDTRLQCAELICRPHSIATGTTRHIAGGHNESVMQPQFSPAGELHFLSDRQDYWYLYKEPANTDASALTGAEPTLVLQVEGEIGVPAWVFAESRYAFRADGSIVHARTEGGVDYLEGYPQYSSFSSLRSDGDSLVFIASSWHSESVVVCDGNVISRTRDLADSLGIDNQFLQAAEKLVFATDDNDQAYALFFPPANPGFVAVEGEKPPLIVLAHGGPTSAARSDLKLARQFWTSRGFAVVDVNYRGSTGFGRAYRQKLNGQWGVADVADCVNVARYLVERGDVDARRLIIRGGSAGGFTVLSALAFHDVFTAGANLYGVADLEALATDTHKFESRYLDSLVGPYPQYRERYQARSPIHHLEGFSAPMIVLQGSEDAIVPPNQSRMIVEALERRKVAVAYLEFEGEQHGFRKAETIKTALAAELAFYGQVFGFEPAGSSGDIEIRNL